MNQSEFKAYLDTAPFTCSDTQWEQVCRYHALLQEWNQKINLISRTMLAEKVWGELFYDSLAPLQFDLPGPGSRCVDIGTGGGLPGIMLAILRPDLEITLLDSIQKRTRFLDVSRETLGLDHMQVVRGRAEDIGSQPEFSGQFDYAVFKAVAAADRCMALAEPFLNSSGRVLMYKSMDIDDELAAAQHKFPCYSYRQIGYYTADNNGKRQLILAEKNEKD